MKKLFNRAASALALGLAMTLAAPALADRYSKEPEPFLMDTGYMEVSTDINTLQGCTTDHHGMYLDVRVGIRLSDNAAQNPALTEKFVREMKSAFFTSVNKHSLNRFLPPDETGYDALDADMDKFFNAFEAANGVRMMWNPKAFFLRKDNPDPDCLQKAGIAPK